MIKKIIILGSRGMLGTYLSLFFERKNFQVIRITRNDYDVMENSFEYLEDLLIKLEIDFETLVINCIGTIPHASKDYPITNCMYIKINSIFPQVLSQLCDKYQSILIHPTTDCVYDGKKGMYKEDNLHDESSIYGVTKSLGEPDGACVIRCSIIGEELKNKRSLVEWVKSNKNGKIKGFVNHYWNGVTCLQYAKILETMIQKNIFWKGVRHICSPDNLTKFEIVSSINKTYDLNIEIEPYQCKTECNRTLSSNYDCSIFGIPLIAEQITELYQFNLC